jgi:hypothetical protein
MILLALGSSVLVIYSAALAWQFHAAVNGAAIDALGFFGSAGLAVVRAMRNAVLDHAALMLVARRMLVLCSALIVTLIGIALWSRRASGTGRFAGRSVPTLPEGEQ